MLHVLWVWASAQWQVPIIDRIALLPTRPLCSIDAVLPRLQPSAIFSVSIAFPFPEYHIVGLVEYVDLSDWLLSLSNVHVRFVHVFSELDSSFLFSSE